MTSFGNSIIGIVFLVIAAILTFLMYYIWKFPFDHEKNKSDAPRSLIRIHRLLGVAYVAIYVYLMWQMVPRLWVYQIELPPRTVMHLTLGITIGALLFTKLTIVRFFKHLEAKLAPFLGSALFVCTFLMVALALPFSLREAYLQRTALGDATMTESRVARVREQLPSIGLEDEQLLSRLATREGLLQGRRTMAAKCVQCHDLRTVLARPRTPKNWKQTVSRMADRSTILNPITTEDQWYVTAYLIAVSPTLQETLKQRRKAAMTTVGSQQAMAAAVTMMDKPELEGDYVEAEARKTYETTCSLCHSHTQVENAPPSTKEEAVALVGRMVGNGLSASDKELNTVIRYLVETYVGDADPDPGQGASTVSDLTGQSLYSEKLCITCHGPEGKSPIDTNYPVLAGQNKEYLIQQIRNIKTGARNNGLTSVMNSVVQGVSDEEIESIAAYLSTVE